MAVTGAIVTGIATAASIRQQRKAAKAQEAATEKQAKIAEAQNARQRRKQVIEARRQRAVALAQGEAQGIGGGSQVSGAVGSIGSQAASNVSFLQGLESLDQARFDDLQRANRASSRAATFGAIANQGSNFESFVKTS